MLRAPEGIVFSHQTAAALLGIPLPETIELSRVHVAVEFPRTPPRGRGVTGHSLGRVSAARVGPFPICAPAQVWCQLAALLPREDLVAAGDHLLGARKRPAVVNRETLAAEATQCRRTKGTAARAWALTRVRSGADSRPESLLRLLLEEAGYRHLQINEPVVVGAGRLVLHPDISIPSLRIAVEYEGDGHRVDARQWHADIERHGLLEAAGWRVVRVTARELFHHRDAFLARLVAVTHSARMSASASARHSFVPNA